MTEPIKRYRWSNRHMEPHHEGAYAAHADYEEALQKMRARAEKAEAELADWLESAAKVMAEECPADEAHCACVPVLRERVKKLEDSIRPLLDYSWTEVQWTSGPFQKLLRTCGDVLASSSSTTP